MTTLTAAARGVSKTTLAALSAAILGLGIVYVTGHVQADTLHAATHDMRHALGFPCH